MSAYSSMFLIPKDLYESLQQSTDGHVRDAIRAVNVRQFNNLHLPKGAKVNIKASEKADAVSARSSGHDSPPEKPASTSTADDTREEEETVESVGEDAPLTATHSASQTSGPTVSHFASQTDDPPAKPPTSHTSTQVGAKSKSKGVQAGPSASSYSSRSAQTSADYAFPVSTQSTSVGSNYPSTQSTGVGSNYPMTELESGDDEKWQQHASRGRGGKKKKADLFDLDRLSLARKAQLRTTSRGRVTKPILAPTPSPLTARDHFGPSTLIQIPPRPPPLSSPPPLPPPLSPPPSIHVPSPSPYVDESAAGITLPKLRGKRKFGDVGPDPTFVRSKEPPQKKPYVPLTESEKKLKKLNKKAARKARKSAQLIDDDEPPIISSMEGDDNDGGGREKKDNKGKSKGKSKRKSKREDDKDVVFRLAPRDTSSGRQPPRRSGRNKSSEWID